MKRREFIKTTAAAAMLLALPIGVHAAAEARRNLYAQLDELLKWRP